MADFSNFYEVRFAMCFGCGRRLPAHASMSMALCDEAVHAAGDVTNKHSFCALTYSFERRVKLFKLIKTVNQWAGVAAGLDA